VLYLFFFRNPAQFILQCNGNFGFEESFLLFATHITNVLKLKNIVKYWNFDFRTGFGTLIHAQTLGFWGELLTVPKTTVFDTELECLMKATELRLIGFLGSCLRENPMWHSRATCRRAWSVVAEAPLVPLRI
jgi:hypothetical protein